MDTPLQFQVRLDLTAEAAEIHRQDPLHSELMPLTAVLSRFAATLSCQYDAFAGFLAEAERGGATETPLYRWTKATVENPAKREKYLRSFTVTVSGRDLYDRTLADALETSLQPLVGAGLVTRLAKHDTNPANNPQPPARFG